MKKQSRKSPRHAFRFKILDESDKPKVLTFWAKVKKATRPVQLTLTAADVRRSIRSNGVGNTQKCAMAVCAKRQKDQFPHPVEGYVDWQYRMCYVVTKISAENGFPTGCVAYQHGDEIARLNDTAGGQQKLLERLEETGDRTIFLRPPEKYRPTKQGKQKGLPSGERSPRPAHISSDAMKRPVGARLRFAVAHAGGVKQ